MGVGGLAADAAAGRGNWVSTLTVAFTEKAASYDDRCVNPIGLQVVGYSVDRKDNGSVR